MTFTILPAPGYMAQQPMYRVGDASSTTTTVTLPAGVVDGDLMIGIGYTDSSAALSTPSGWTLITSGSNSYTNSTYGTTKYQNMSVWKRVAASEGATITLAGRVTAVAVYRNATGINVYSAFATIGYEQADPSTITIPSITPTLSGALLALLGRSTLETLDSTPAGLAEIQSESDATYDLIRALYEQRRGPGSTGTKTFTCDTSSPADSPGMMGVMMQVY